MDKRPKRSINKPVRYADSDSGDTSASPHPPKAKQKKPKGKGKAKQDQASTAMTASTATTTTASTTSKSKTKSKTTSTSKTAQPQAPGSAAVAPTPAVPTRRARQDQAQPRGRGRGRGKGPTEQRQPAKKVGRGRGMTAEEVAAIVANAEERERHLVKLVDSLSIADMKMVLVKVGKEQPSFILDLLDLLPRPQGPQMPQPAGAPHWCVCTNCRPMATPVEEVCCRQAPTSCISRTPEMHALCIDAHVLHLSMLYRADVLAVANLQGGTERARHASYRYAGYRQFTLWQHGRLGAGERRVIPSCCLWKIRDSYPDSSGQYVPFRPGMNM